MSRYHSIDDVWKHLDSIPMFSKVGAAAANFSLDNISSFCDALGNPQNNYPVIHVAGTNGKGTTSYLLEKIYSDAGFKTGLFTSPHLLRYNERVRVFQQEISDDQILQFFQYAEDYLEEFQLTYFEISTALAFWFFAEQKVDIAIIEVGLGGRLDSTNIIEPEVSVITSIGLDHQQILGNTIEEIAAEKAGIIKQGKPVVLGNITMPAQNVIENYGIKNNSMLYKSKDLNPKWNNGMITLKNGEISIKTSFRESVNKWNVAAAWLVLEILQDRFSMDEKMICSSIETFKGAPGRFEKMHSNYEWYFSGSHNVQSLISTWEAVQSMKSIHETTLIFSALRDKVNEEMMEYLQDFKKIYFVEQEGERAAKYEDIRAYIQAEQLKEDQWEIILNELKTELVIFTGSFYFYPIVKRWTTNVS